MGHLNTGLCKPVCAKTFRLLCSLQHLCTCMNGNKTSGATTKTTTPTQNMDEHTGQTERGGFFGGVEQRANITNRFTPLLYTGMVKAGLHVSSAVLTKINNVIAANVTTDTNCTQMNTHIHKERSI